MTPEPIVEYAQPHKYRGEICDRDGCVQMVRVKLVKEAVEDILLVANRAKNRPDQIVDGSDLRYNSCIEMMEGLIAGRFHQILKHKQGPEQAQGTACDRTRWNPSGPGATPEAPIQSNGEAEATLERMKRRFEWLMGSRINP